MMTQDASLHAGSPEGLRRTLRLLDVAALGLNGVIGTGIFFLPGKVAPMPAGIAVAVLAMLICGWLVAESEPAHIAGGLVAVALGLAIHLPSRCRNAQGKQRRTRI